MSHGMRSSCPFDGTEKEKCCLMVRVEKALERVQDMNVLQIGERRFYHLLRLSVLGTT